MKVLRIAMVSTVAFASTVLADEGPRTGFYESRITPVEPPKIEQIRQHRHVFLIGSNDPALNDTKRVLQSYKAAAVEHSALILVPYLRHEWPGPSYFSEAIDYLDVRAASPTAPAHTP